MIVLHLKTSMRSSTREHFNTNCDVCADTAVRWTKRCLWHFSTEMSSWYFLFDSLMQNEMAKTVWKNSPSSLSYGFFPTDQNQRLRWLQTINFKQVQLRQNTTDFFQRKTGGKLGLSAVQRCILRALPQCGFKVRQVWCWRPGFQCPESGTDLSAPFTRGVAKRHKSLFIFLLLI